MMEEDTQTPQPISVTDPENTTLPDRGDDRVRDIEAADPDAFARLSDPSMAERRARISTQVKDPAGLHWVPATELLRQRSQRAGDVIAKGHENVHRLVRDRTVTGVKRTASFAAERVAALGRPQPVGESRLDASMVRDTAH